MHLALVTVDCLRADHLGCYGHSAPTSPRLDQLAETAWLFDNAVVAGTPTFYSFPAIHASRHPLDLGRDSVGLVDGEATLATALRDAGYATAAFVAGNPYLASGGARPSGYAAGFDHYEDFLRPPEPSSDSTPAPSTPAWRRAARRVWDRLNGPATPKALRRLLFELWLASLRHRTLDLDHLRQYPPADTVVDRALDWLGRRPPDQPFFLWVHLMDPHHPYYPPREDVAHMVALNARWSRDDFGPASHRAIVDPVHALYEAGIRHADAQIGRLIDALDGHGLDGHGLGSGGLHSHGFNGNSPTLLAVTGDHGEEFLEHGGRYHYPTSLARELTHVPLLVRDPRRPDAQRVEGPFSLLDLAPTLLAALGVDPPGTFRGASRLQNDTYVASRRAITECVYDRRSPWTPGDESGLRLLAVQEGPHKLVVHFERGTAELFDLADDPGERTPLEPEALPEVRGRLLRALHEHLGSQHSQRGSALHVRAQGPRLRELLATGALP